MDVNHTVNNRDTLVLTMKLRLMGYTQQALNYSNLSRRGRKANYATYAWIVNTRPDKERLAMTTLSSRAMLVTLNICQWSARKFDKRETLALAMRHGVADNTARVNKNLLPTNGTNALEAVHKKTSELRQLFGQQTLPWAQEGTRILKSNAYVTFTQDWGRAMDDWRSLTKLFMADYPTMRCDAAHNMGSLFDANDYPDPHDMARRFKIDMVFMPVPDARDWRIDLGDEALAHLEKQIEERVMQAQGAAVADAWRRVYEVVSKAHERLSGPDNIFRDSLVENAVELCAILPGLNIVDDPNLETMRRDLEGSLCKYNPGTLRSDPAVRSQVAGQMDDLMARMGAFYQPQV